MSQTEHLQTDNVTRVIFFFFFFMSAHSGMKSPLSAHRTATSRRQDTFTNQTQANEIIFLLDISLQSYRGRLFLSFHSCRHHCGNWAGAEPRAWTEQRAAEEAAKIAATATLTFSLLRSRGTSVHLKHKRNTSSGLQTQQ